MEQQKEIVQADNAEAERRAASCAEARRRIEGRFERVLQLPLYRQIMRKVIEIEERKIHAAAAAAE